MSPGTVSMSFLSALTRLASLVFTGKSPSFLELVSLSMQWGLTAENAEHITQAKSAQVLKKSLHRKRAALNDSVNTSDISRLSGSLLQRILGEMCTLPSPRPFLHIYVMINPDTAGEPQISAKICSSLKELQMRRENTQKIGSK